MIVRKTALRKPAPEQKAQRKSELDNDLEMTVRQSILAIRSKIDSILKNSGKIKTDSNA